MDVSGNTVLITGGGTGIGFALAEKFVDAGSVVIVCGRRKTKLRLAKQRIPALHIRQCDISIESRGKAGKNLQNNEYLRFTSDNVTFP